MTNYPLGDFLIRVKNASLAGLKEISFPANSKVKAVASVLKKEGYLDDVKEKSGVLTITLSFSHKEPVLMGLKVISKPGLRVYMGAQELENKKGVSVFIVSTPKGILTSKVCIKERVGGEVIAEVW